MGARKPKIFIVEDSELQTLFIKSELERLGYEVVGAEAAGEKAVDRILASKPDLLILDIRLAGSMEGSDVAKQVFDSMHIPHIYTTAYSNEEYFVKSTSTNPSGYIIKPFTSTTLDFQIRLALQNAEARRLVEERERKLQALIVQSGDAIIITDSAGKVLEWNPRAEQILGIPRAETMGKYVWDVRSRLVPAEMKTGEAVERIRREMSAAYEPGAIAKTGSVAEIPVELPDGRRRTMQVSYFRIEEKDDFQICGIVRDITLQKEYEYDQETLYRFLTACNALSDSRILVREYCRLLMDRLKCKGAAGFLTNEVGGFEFVHGEGVLTKDLLDRAEVSRLLDELCRADKRGEAGDFPGLVSLGNGLCTLADFPASAGLPLEAWGAAPSVLYVASIRSESECFGLVLFCVKDDETEKPRMITLVDLTREQLASTLKRFSAEKILKEQNKLLTVRDLLASKVNSSLDLDEILDLALKVMSENLRADGGMVHLYDEGAKRLGLYRELGVAEELKARFSDLSLNDTILGPSAALGTTIIVDDLSLSTDKVPEAAAGHGWRSFVCAALKREEKLFGVLSFFSTEIRRFDKAASEIMSAAAKIIAVAIENGFLYRRLSLSNEELERRVRERTNNLEVLNTISQNLNYVMDYRSLFSLLFSHLWSSIRFDVAVGFLREDSGSKVFVYKACAISADLENFLKTRIEGKVWTLSGAFQSPSSILFIDPEGTKSDPARTLKSLSSFHEAPIYDESELMAYVLIAAERKDAFSENQLQLFNIVVNQSAVLIKRLRELLSSERTRLEQLVENLPEGILLVDRNGRIVVRNSAAYAMLRDLFGGTVPEFLTELGGVKIDAILPIDGTKPSGSAEIQADGDRLLLVTAVPIVKGPDEGGSIFSIQDITAERRQEAQMKLRERLAAVGQLAAGIAHDFNNILTGIIGYSEYLQLRMDVTDSAKSYLRKIVEQSKRAGSLIQQILDFSRKSIVEYHSIDLVPFCKEMAKLFTRLIAENIRIDFTTAEKCCTVRGDPTQIQQILTNLVVNSRDAMPEGGVITLSLDTVRFLEGDDSPTVGLAPGTWARLSVADTGTGIPKDHLPRVFDPFFTTKEVGKGSGLGLAQVYGLVQQHQGHIGIESTLGEGTKIDIYLPLTAVEDSEAEEAAEVRLPLGSEGVILLAEDEDGVREVIANVLREVGFTVFVAADGREGMEIFASHRDRIELVLSDIVMPRAGGRELFREVRRWKPEFPFVFMTGHPLGEEDGVEELKKATAILRKPLEFATLIGTINDILSTAKGPDDHR